MSALSSGMIIPAGHYFSTVLPDLDFETYSEAGYFFDEKKNKWVSMGSGNKNGLAAVGSMNYSLHPSTEILCMAYNLKNGEGKKLWTPSMPPPLDLLEYVAKGGLIEAHNSGFEHHIWNNILVKRFGFPELKHTQQRCSMAKARAYALPGKLEKGAIALNLEQQKDTEGKRLIKKFCQPRQPTKNDNRRRIRPEEDPEDFKKLCDYCLQDIETESDLSQHIPDLQPDELEFWLNTQRSNYAGVGIKKAEVESCIAILEQAYTKYNAELFYITGGEITEASKVQQLTAWVNKYVRKTVKKLDDEAISALLKEPIPPQVKRALEIRQLIGSAGVKKIYAMRNLATPEERLCDLFVYHGARTGRDTGADVQPQNLVKAGVDIQWCSICEKPFGHHHEENCPFCGGSLALFGEKRNEGKWSWEAVDHALEVIATESLDFVEYIFDNPVLTISGCIRGLLQPSKGFDYICSDYSAIEAVVAATLAGEEWRIKTFKEKKDIYLQSASEITGTPYEEYLRYHKETGSKHPDRQNIGKVAELALGYGGWINAWRQFDDTDNFSDDAVKQNILDWRKASPTIVEMWGGQPNYRRAEFFGLEGMAILSVMNSGKAYSYRGITYQVLNDVMYCFLPSGRALTYHQPRVAPSLYREGQLELSFMGWNSNPAMGAIGWVRIKTFGGRLFENVVQAVSRDIMRDATNRLERHGYPIVLRVHDELVAEVPEGFGTIEEFERLMGEMPSWAQGWAVRASGGWRGKRYRKD